MRMLEEYARIVILFSDDTYKVFDGHDLVSATDIAHGQLVIGIRQDGITRILKNRWGNKT